MRAGEQSHAQLAFIRSGPAAAASPWRRHAAGQWWAWSSCLESCRGALHQQQLEVLLALKVLLALLGFRALQGFVDPVGQLSSTGSKLHEAETSSQKPQSLQVT